LEGVVCFSLQFSVYILFFKLGMFLWITFGTIHDYWLTSWTTKDDLSKDDNLFYYLIYSGLGMISILCLGVRTIVVGYGIFHVNKGVHDDVITKLIKAPINLFHDVVPKGQIINRLTKDLEKVSDIGWSFGYILAIFFGILGAIALCAFFEPYSLLFLPVMLTLSLIVTRFGISAGRDLTRLEGIRRSPILALLSETNSGLSTIRAFDFVEQFKNKYMELTDQYILVCIYQSGARNWMGMAIDFTANLLVLFLVVITMLLKDRFTAQAIGLFITYSLSVSDYLFGLVNEFTNYERGLVCLERINQYSDISQEKPLTLPTDSEIQMTWPSKGEIIFKDVNIRYRPNTELILKNLSFSVRSKEKIGIIGRTGSGKSTMCLCLFRLLECESGNIFIDDLDIAQMGLQTLRDALTIIPQVFF
jgi:ABC-type multidrug transport system fused ATPase/permease subunit